MSGGDKQGFGIIIMVIVVIAFGMLMGLLKAITENPGYALLVAGAIVLVYILRKKDQERVERNSQESRSGRKPR